MMKLLSLVLFSLALGCAAPLVAAVGKKEHCGKGGHCKNKGAKKEHKKGPKKVLTAEEKAARKEAGAKKRAERAAKKAAAHKD